MKKIELITKKIKFADAAVTYLFITKIYTKLMRNLFFVSKGNYYGRMSFGFH